MPSRCILCALLASIVMSLWASLSQGQLLTETLQPLQPVQSTEPTPSSTASKPKVVYREKSYYDFEDSLINGNLRKPDGSFVFRKNQSTFSSALNLKRSFIPELRESTKSTR